MSTPHTDVIAGEVFGVKTDFEIKQERVGDEIRITVSYQPPPMLYDRERNILHVWQRAG